MGGDGLPDLFSAKASEMIDGRRITVDRSFAEQNFS